MEILGNLPELGDLIRRHFIDEIFVTGPCERGVVKRLIAQASVGASMFAWCLICTMGWHGARRLNMSANFRPCRCIAITSPWLGC